MGFGRQEVARQPHRPERDTAASTARAAIAPPRQEIGDPGDRGIDRQRFQGPWEIDEGLLNDLCRRRIVGDGLRDALDPRMKDR